MLVLVLSLMAAPQDGPPPYSRTLACAGLTRAWSDQLPSDAPDARESRSDAEFWAFAVMDAARRSGHTAAVAEADQLKARDAARAMFTDQPDEAAKDLETCRKMKPPGV
ncbi:MAG: hypothetical protein KF842_05880 [Caulobacter sp.]|nr:hypothetical protein [Caulobacter sp.]